MAAKTPVRLSALARADLREIARYTAERWSIDQETHYAGEIRDALVQLGDGSREGRPIEACEGYWKLRVRSHFIVYRKADNGFDVVPRTASADGRAAPATITG